MRKVSKNDAMPPFEGTNVTGSVVVKGHPGYLHGFSVNAVTTGGTMAVYDGTSASGTLKGTYNIAARAAGANVPDFLSLGIGCETGIYVAFTTLVADLTAIWK